MHKTNLIEAAYLPRLEFPDLDELLSMPILPLHAPFRSPHALPRRAARGMRRKQRPALDGDHSVPLRAGWRGRGCSGSRRRRGRGQILTAAVTRHTPEAAAIHRRVASNSSSPNFDPPPPPPADSIQSVMQSTSPRISKHPADKTPKQNQIRTKSSHNPDTSTGKQKSNLIYRWGQ